jgi:hypothetical protein
MMGGARGTSWMLRQRQSEDGRIDATVCIRLC